MFKSKSVLCLNGVHKPKVCSLTGNFETMRGRINSWIWYTQINRGTPFMLKVGLRANIQLNLLTDYLETFCLKWVTFCLICVHISNALCLSRVENCGVKWSKGGLKISVW